MTRWNEKRRGRAIRLGLGLVLGLVGSPVGAAAQTPPAPPAPPAPPTLRRVLEIALDRNPDIRQARLRVDSAHGERRIARGLPNPVYTGIPGTPYQYSVALPIDLTPERVFRTRAARQGEDATTFGRSDVIRQIVFTVRQGFYDLLLADAQRVIAVEQRDIFQQLLRADSTRLRAGDIPERDLVKSELELARAEATLTRADAGVRAARLALQALMGLAVPDTAFTVSGTLQGAPQLTAPLDSLLPLALARRPDLAAARAQVDQSGSLKALATASLFPVPTLSLVYQRDPFQSSARPFQTSGLQYAFGVAVPIPLFYWNGGERQRASASLAAAQVAVERTRVQIESDVAVAIGSFRSTQVLADRYQAGLLQKSAAALETSRFAYQQGAISLLELLDAIRTWGDTRSEYNSAVHDYWVAAYALSRGTGVEVVRE